MMNVRTIAGALIVGTCLMSGAQAATIGYCNNYGLESPEVFVLQTFGLDVTDMTYSGKTPTENADNCWGVDGGNDNAGIGDLFGGDWTLLTKSDDASAGNALNGIDFTATAVTGSGTWAVTGTGDPLPQFFDFVGVLKQGSGSSGGGWAAYFFDNVTFDGEDGGTYFVSFFGDNGTLALSHLSLYGRTGEEPPVVPPEQIPEPGTLALVGLALLGAASARRRRA